MGFVSGFAADRIKKFYKNDKERAAYKLAKSALRANYQGANYGMLNSYGYDALSDYLDLENDLLGKYADYESMQETPEVASAIDIFADDSTQTSLTLKRVVWVTSSDRYVQQLLDELLQKTLRIDEDIWEIARTMCMYGNSFEEILVDETGVCGLNYMPPPTVRRIEGPRGELYGFIQDYRGKLGFNQMDLQNLLASRRQLINDEHTMDYFNSDPNAVNPSVGLRDEEVAHFRLKGGYRRSIYGCSVLEPSRWVWKRLVLMEDAALIYRLQRAPERFAIGVDVGDLPAAEVPAYLNKMRQQHKKKRYVDSGGRVNLKFEAISPDDDFIYGVRKGVEGAKITTLTSPSWQSVTDIELFLDKMIAGLKIPKAYLGREEGVVRSSLSQIDIRMCRTVMRIQRELINGLEKICRIHLMSRGIDPASHDFEIHMTSPSPLMEMGQIEAQTAKAQLATALREHVSLYWVLQNVMGLSDEEIQGIIKQREDEMTHDIMIQMQAQGQGQMALQAMMPQPQMPGQLDPNALAALKDKQDGDFTPTQLPPDAQQMQMLAGPQQQNKPPVFSNFIPRLGSYKIKPLSEVDLFKGRDKEAEKRAEDKLDKVFRQNKELYNELKDIQASLQELSYRNRQ